MKRSVLLLMTVMLALSCKKKDSCPQVSITAPASEVSTLRAYLQTNNINATEDPRGFFYTIDVTGTGDKPTSCSNVTVNYVGKLTNGSTFESANNVSFNLGGLIAGWQEGIPLVAQGGTITLYLPPSLAYGSQQNGSIPPNSNLIFKIDLTAVF